MDRIPSLIDKRHCVRCGADLHMSAEQQPHLCPDIAKRLARREKQVQAVMDILEDALDGYGDSRPWAELIVAKLANMGVTDD